MTDQLEELERQTDVAQRFQRMYHQQKRRAETAECELAALRATDAPKLDPNPPMPCTVVLDEKPYPIGSSFHAFVTAVIAMERALVAAREELVKFQEDKAFLACRLEEARAGCAARAEAERERDAFEAVSKAAIAAMEKMQRT